MEAGKEKLESSIAEIGVSMREDVLRVDQPHLVVLGRRWEARGGGSFMLLEDHKTF